MTLKLRPASLATLLVGAVLLTACVLRLHPDSGALAAEDPALRYAGGLAIEP